MITPFADWPRWLQILVVTPNGFLAWFAFYFWWPKSDKEWRRFGFVAAYLIVFLLVMVSVFHAKDPAPEP
jgi:hypothetical protein